MGNTGSKVMMAKLYAVNNNSVGSELYSLQRLCGKAVGSVGEGETEAQRGYVTFPRSQSH